jgi:phenylpropionate dioxygenase-like ring-hydroxylating dioxygenase large terminal subunit
MALDRMPDPAAARAVPASWDRRGLPPWAYASEELLELEREHLFRRRWQLVGHLSDMPGPGDYLALDVAGERALVIRDRDGVVRGFHNLCRHRGSRVVTDERGTCKTAIFCPFHGWTYNLDGTLRGPASPSALPPLDRAAWGLKPLETEIWRGFVFVRFKPSDQPSVAALMARFEDEIAPYAPEDMVPAGAIDWGTETPVNWKSVRDVDNEGYHVPMAHPGLEDLYGANYYDEPFRDGVSRSFAPFSADPGKLWSVRRYKSLLPDAEWLPESHRRAWLYYGLFPNAAMVFYPDSIGFYQEFPEGVARTRLRGAIYRRREESRALRAARYLSGRIDRLTAEEDQMLTVWSCEATRSSAFEGVLLSDLEYGVKTYHDHLRAVLPVLTLSSPPPAGTLAAANADMLGSGADG